MPMTSHSAMTSTFRPPAYQSNSVNMYSPACTRVHTTAHTVGYIWREYEAVETSICWTRQSQTSYFAPVLPNGKSLEQYVLFLPPALSEIGASKALCSKRPTNIIMWPADVAELSVDGWQPNEDDVVTQSQRLVPSVLSDTAEQCRPGVDASSCRVCTWRTQPRQASEDRRVVAASDHGRTSSCHWPLALPHSTLVVVCW